MCCSLSFSPVGSHLSPLHLTGVGGGVFKIVFILFSFFELRRITVDIFLGLMFVGGVSLIFPASKKPCQFIVSCSMQRLCVSVSASMCVCPAAAVCFCRSLCAQECFLKKSPCPRQAARFVHDKTVYFIITARRLLPVQRQKEVPLVLLFSCF